MKMKKLLLVVSMLAVVASLAGCSEEKEAPFDYDEQSLALSTMAAFEQYENVDEDYAQYYLSDGTEFEQSAVKGIQQAINNDKVGTFEDYSQYIDDGVAVPASKYEIVNDTDSVSVTVINQAQNRNVEITVKYVENPEYYIQYDQLAAGITVEEFRNQLDAYGYDEQDYLDAMGYSNVNEVIEAAKGNIDSELQSEGIYPYEAEEMVVSPVYSTKELMTQAGKNTLIGMGTVFIVLIFISFIISLFKFLPALFAKKPEIKAEKNEAPKSAPVAVKVPTSQSENLMDDAELVAVITAAIYAANGSVPTANSKDKLIVRSIRRARR